MSDEDVPSPAGKQTANVKTIAGYGKPPVKSQFKKGRSGNPKGRPKKARNLKTELRESAAETVKVNVGGKPKKLSVYAATLLVTGNEALQGDVRAGEKYRSAIEKHVPEQFENDTESLASATDREIILATVQRMNGYLPTTQNTADQGYALADQDNSLSQVVSGDPRHGELQNHSLVEGDAEPNPMSGEGSSLQPRERVPDAPIQIETAIVKGTRIATTLAKPCAAQPAPAAREVVGRRETRLSSPFGGIVRA